MSSRIFRSAGALALAVAALTACTSPDSASTADPTTEAATTAAVEETTAAEETTPAEETPAADAACAGVELIVDSGDLPTDVSGSWCVDTDAAIAATDLLAEAGVTTEGTTEYGDQVVCRVDGEPSATTVLTAEDGSDYSETCESMPAAFAYWSMWVKPAAGEWGYAEEGLATLKLEPGTALELLFTLNGAPAAP